jgi:hypothetical protein
VFLLRTWTRRPPRFPALPWPKSWLIHEPRAAVHRWPSFPRSRHTRSVWLLLNGGKESGLAAGFAPTILRTIHTSADDGDKLSAGGMTLIYNAVLGLLLELDAR